MATKLDPIVRGDSASYDLNVTYEENQNPVDLTGMTVYFGIKKNIADAELLIEKTIIDHVDAEAGQSRIELSSSDTDALTAGVHKAQIRVMTGEDQLISTMIFEVQIAEKLFTPEAP
jgi:hypothetical protein